MNAYSGLKGRGLNKVITMLDQAAQDRRLLLRHDRGVAQPQPARRGAAARSGRR